VTAIPATHIADAQLLNADGLIELFKLQPTSGGTVYFKPGADAQWQGQTYTGLPCSLSGLKKSSDNSSSQPRLTIGTTNIDLSAFKPLVHDGYLDGATFVYYRVLLTHLVSNTNIADVKTYRVKRIVSYSRSQLLLDLSSSSDAMQFTIPNLQYYPPAFPAVMLDN
jgi:phage-related protein